MTLSQIHKQHCLFMRHKYLPDGVCISLLQAKQDAYDESFHQSSRSQLYSSSLICCRGSLHLQEWGPGRFLQAFLCLEMLPRRAEGQEQRLRLMVAAAPQGSQAQAGQGLLSWGC